jgi:hypothetical protein
MDLAALDPRGDGRPRDPDWDDREAIVQALDVAATVLDVM